MCIVGDPHKLNLRGGKIIKSPLQSHPPPLPSPPPPRAPRLVYNVDLGLFLVLTISSLTSGSIMN